MREAYQNIFPETDIMQLADGHFRRLEVFVHRICSVWSMTFPQLTLARENLAVMATVATHYHVLVVSCTCKPHDMSWHMSRGIKKQKTSIAKKVQGLGKRSERNPVISLVGELAYARMLENGA